MTLSRLSIVSLFAVALPALMASSAMAKEIGSVIAVKPSVTGTASGMLSVGSVLHEDEVIQSASSGSADLLLRDNTRLRVGPGSTLKLDQFVYAGGQKASSVVLGLTKGTFRFVTGASAKKAYQIETPLASIGVRGTILNIGVSGRAVAVTLREGAADICLRRGINTGRCVAMNRIGQTLVVHANGTVTAGTGVNPANGVGGNYFVRPVTPRPVRRPR